MFSVEADVYSKDTNLPSTSTISPSVMMSGDSTSIDSRSIPPMSYDLPDDARPGVLPPVIPLTSTTKLNTDDDDKRESDAERIEEVTSIVKKTLPSPEPRPKIQQNGVDNGKKMESKFADSGEDDACVKCIYFTQQMCECVIV